MVIHRKKSKKLVVSILTLCLLLFSQMFVFAQSASLPTDRARVTVVPITDPYGGSKPLKVIRTDSNTPLRAGTAWIWEKGGKEEPESYYVSMSSKGLNAVRMILFDVWEAETYTPGPTFTLADWNDLAYRTRQLARMERSVNYASANGMYVIINAHNHIPSYKEDYCNALWKYVAPYFANRTHVIYEGANEPMSGIGRNGDMDMGTAEAKASPRLQALKRTYNIIREAAPNTFILVLTPPGINDYNMGTGMGNLADSFSQLPGAVDWTKTGVGYHLYNNDAAYGAATNAANLRNLHSRYPGLPTENNFPASVSNATIGVTDSWRSATFDKDSYTNQTCEKLGIGWCMWNINGQTQFNHNWPLMWADAVTNGWAWTKDNIIPVSIVTAHGENLPNEGVAKINDGILTTNWLDLSTTSWVQFAYEKAQLWNTYQLGSGIDAQNTNRNPKDWTLLASNDGTTWTTLDTQTNQAFAAISTAYTYAFNNSTAYKYYKLDITANNGGSGIELSELQFSYIDRTAPSIPTGLVFSKSFVLSWTASTDNIGVASYEVFNKEVSLGKTTTNSFILSSVIPNTEYSFTVKACDAANNWSDKSTVLAANTGVFINYEAENATISGGLIATDHPGYTGAGFWGNVGTAGNYLEFTVYSETGGSTDITCRFSSGDSNKTMNLYVNGIKIRTVTFPTTSGWDNWASKVDNVTLNAGNNTIKYQYDTGNTGYINVDYITVKANTTGVLQNTKNNKLILYPNPASESITISNITNSAIISIRSIDGKLIYEQSTKNSDSFSVNVSKFKKGMYMVSVKSGVQLDRINFVVF